jgi:predicted house-cleaning noncanonical NTP pyrophosphatase (MazG superfamily)
MKKLIRDKLPAMVLEKEGRAMDTYIAEQSEYLQLLKEKLVEEANEVLSASPENLLEELADVLEVFAAVCKAHGFEESVFEAREKKFSQRGGFTEKIVLVGPCKK